MLVVKLSKQNSWSDVTLASLDDMSRAKKMPCVIQIRDLHVPEMMIFVEIQQEDPSENYAPTLGWSLRLFLGGSLFLDDE